MEKFIKSAFWEEIEKGKSFYETKNFDEAFKHFERSHILGQKSPLLHTYSHFCMLKVAIVKRDFNEIFGQLFRIPSGFLGSMLGIYPQGNTGGANVGAFKKMKIPEDLEEILNKK
jgi:hypothetical protein